MFIVAGLGNPGRQYEGTRHNMGFETIDIISDKCGINVNIDKHRNSQDPKYGGRYEAEKTIYRAVKSECDGRPYHVEYKLPPYGCAVFEFNVRKPAKEKKASSAKNNKKYR